MKNVWAFIYKYQDDFFKGILVLVCTVLTVYFFPKSDRYKYDYDSGEPWQYETLYAPFGFSVNKNQQEIEQEREAIAQKASWYFEKDTLIETRVRKSLLDHPELQQIDSLLGDQVYLKDRTSQLLDQVYKFGYLSHVVDIESRKKLIINDKKSFKEYQVKQLTLSHQTIDAISNQVLDLPDSLAIVVKKIFLQEIEPNVFYNQRLTDETIAVEQEKIITTRGYVSKNARIIAQGEIVEGDQLDMLNTLNSTYSSTTWTDTQYYWKSAGYLVLIAMAFLMLLLFLKQYRPAVYKSNRQSFFVYFNVVFMILLSAMVMKWQSEYIYVIPVCLVPLILKAFFDARLGLFAHVISILVISFMVPNSDEYLFLQMIAGIVTILAGSAIYKRANLFITIGQIVLIYIIGYFAFYVVNNGGVVGWEWDRLIHFCLCGLALLFVWPLIYIYERLFQLVSDVSLLELSDTNSKLLKELSNKAPGTFHHSLNVANIAEAISNEINANSMLVRVGALYHDIGKMNNPVYFTENQVSGVNPHDDLDPEESARIIINHTLDGIEIAKKHKLPDRIIDFIRTHHGDSLVYYFYKKAMDTQTVVDPYLYRYPGPRPFNKETAILMIADSIEAASRSFTNPNANDISILVDKIVEKQTKDGQFLNTDITFKDLETIKSVIKKKLASMYHLRVVYPE